MKEEGSVINWFEINTPDGRYSINDTIGDILSTTGGKIACSVLVDGRKKEVFFFLYTSSFLGCSPRNQTD